MSDRLKDLIPVPLAAPETRALRHARMRVIVAAALLAVGCLFFTPLHELTGRFAPLAVFFLIVFLAVQVPPWVRAKNRADDDFLMNGCGRDE